LINGVFDVRHFISTHVETKHTDGIKLKIRLNEEETKNNFETVY